MLHQHHTHVGLPLDGRHVQRRVVPMVPHVGVGPGGEEQRDHLRVSEGAGGVAGDQAAVVARMHIGSSVQEVLHSDATTVRSYAYLENKYRLKIQ